MGNHIGNHIVKPARRSNPSLVVKSNQLINSRYTLTVTEMRLFLLMVAQVERDDMDFKPYRIKIKDFVEAVGSNFKDYYKTAEQSSRQLLSRVLEIPTATGNLLQVSFLSSAEYFRGEGVVELSFDPKLKPYLLELKDRFTSYDIRNVLRLQSSHSMRIYELLKQFEPIGKRTFEIMELKKTLGIEKQYKRYNDFKRYVILQAQKELSQHCDITFDFNELKNGKKIVSICFTIIQQEKRHLDTILIKDAPQQDNQEIVKMLCSLGLSPQQADKYAKAKDHEFLKENSQIVREGFKENKIKNPAAYLIKLIEQDAISILPLEEVSGGQAAKPGNGKHGKTKNGQRTDRGGEMEKVEGLKKEFEKVRDQQVKALLKKITAKDWSDFEAYVASVPYLKAKFFEDGKFVKGHKDEQHWLNIFMADKYLADKEKAFTDWAATEKGLLLNKQPEGDSYQFSEAQKSLFSKVGA